MHQVLYSCTQILLKVEANLHFVCFVWMTFENYAIVDFFLKHSLPIDLINMVWFNVDYNRVGYIAIILAYL